MTRIQTQTVAPGLFDALSRMYLRTHIRPFELARWRREAEKLKQTNEPYLGWLGLAVLSVFDGKLSDEEKLAQLEGNTARARALPHDAYTVYNAHYNCLMRLGLRNAACKLTEEYVQTLTDDKEALQRCANHAFINGQMGLAEEIDARLSKLGLDVSASAGQIRDVREALSENDLKPLLAQAVHTLRQSGLIDISCHTERTEDGLFFDMGLLEDSDIGQAAECDIALTRLTVRYARENGINLNRFVLGCRVLGRRR